MNESDSSIHRHSKKKHKKNEKKHKKDKKHKKEKRSYSNIDSEKRAAEEIQPILRLPNSITEIVESQEAFGPVLPPHLLVTKSPNKVEEVLVIGPSLPKGISILTQDLHSEQYNASDVDDEEVFGPLPINNGSLKSMTTAQIELEQRALEIKLAKLDPEANKFDTNVREEWMLELPDVGLKTGLASLKRTFHTKERPDFSDRSSWTKTPNSSDAPSTSKVIETTKSKAEQQYQVARDAEQEKIAKKLKKKHKRDESLYEIHQKKLKKERKERESSGKTERRPFSRDVDSQINKIDKTQTKSIVDKAKFLDSRFSSGNAKYL